jgi:hypothetical protein
VQGRFASACSLSLPPLADAASGQRDACLAGPEVRAAGQGQRCQRAERQNDPSDQLHGAPPPVPPCPSGLLGVIVLRATKGVLRKT